MPEGRTAAPASEPSAKGSMCVATDTAAPPEEPPQVFVVSHGFFVAPKTLGDIPKIQFMWMVLCDQIHHRGQFSVYLRMADGKVPSIYGPTADEPM